MITMLISVSSGPENQHRRQRAQQADNAREQLRHRLGQRHGNRVDVIGQPAHQIAAVMGIKIGKLQPAQMREQISAQFGGGVLRHAYHHALLEKLRDHIGQIDRQKHQTNTRNPSTSPVSIKSSMMMPLMRVATTKPAPKPLISTIETSPFYCWPITNEPAQRFFGVLGLLHH